jgi:hypothetical protein
MDDQEEEMSDQQKRLVLEKLRALLRVSCRSN